MKYCYTLCMYVHTKIFIYSTIASVILHTLVFMSWFHPITLKHKEPVATETHVEAQAPQIQRTSTPSSNKVKTETLAPTITLLDTVSQNIAQGGSLYFVCKPKESGTIEVHDHNHIFNVYFDGTTNYAGPFQVSANSTIYMEEHANLHVTTKTSVNTSTKYTKF